jgi:AcrR family transcriptional regulator
MARPRNQDRRRAELVAAASRLLVRDGVAGARLTDIAAETGLTAATVSYYYQDLSELYAQTYQTATERYITARREHAATVADPAQRLVECLRLGIPRRGESSYDATVLLMELTTLGARDTAFVGPALQFEREQLALFEQIVTAGVAAGAFAPHADVGTVARLLLAAEDGLAAPVVAGRLTADDAFGAVVTAAAALLRAQLPTSR